MAFWSVLPDMADTQPTNCQLSEKLFKTTKLRRGRPETEHHWPCHHKTERVLGHILKHFSRAGIKAEFCLHIFESIFQTIDVVWI